MMIVLINVEIIVICNGYWFKLIEFIMNCQCLQVIRLIMAIIALCIHVCCLLKCGFIIRLNV